MASKHAAPSLQVNMATGHVLYDAKDRHSSKEVLAFVKFIDLHVAKDLEIHVVPKNLSAHKADPVATWLAHPKRGGTCTSPPPVRRGSISWRASSANSLTVT